MERSGMTITTTDDSCAVITDRLTRRFGSFIAVNNVFVAIVDRFLIKNGTSPDALR
jgi:hypothetical protein